MYSVGCENSACSIQSGIDPQPAVFFGISPLQLPRSWWRVSWSAVWNTSSTCCFAHALKVSVYLSKHICPTGNHKIVEPNFETNPVLLFFIYVFFLRGLLVVRLSPLIFLTTEKVMKSLSTHLDKQLAVYLLLRNGVFCLRYFWIRDFSWNTLLKCLWLQTTPAAMKTGQNTSHFLKAI